MSGDSSVTRRVIPKKELLEYRATVKMKIFREIRKFYNLMKHKEGFSQKDLAFALGIDESVLSKRLNGKHDMRLETLSDLARGLECIIDVRLQPIVEAQRLADARRAELQAVYKPYLYTNSLTHPTSTTSSSTANAVVTVGP